LNYRCDLYIPWLYIGFRVGESWVKEMEKFVKFFGTNWVHLTIEL